MPKSRLCTAAAPRRGALRGRGRARGESIEENVTRLPGRPHKTVAATVAECCAACTAFGPSCGTFVFHVPQAGLLNCLVTGACPGRHLKLRNPLKTVGTRPSTPPPPPTPRKPAPPLPPPVTAGTQRNIVVLLADDQDLLLESMRAMPYTMKHIGGAGVNMSNFFVNTPICCPSRTTLLSGRYYHSNKVSKQGAFPRIYNSTYGGCMRMNTSREENPAFWSNSLASRLRRDHGYATGMFGKVLNVMTTLGCNGQAVPHLDRALIMCNHNFFSERWADSLDGSAVANCTGKNGCIAINLTGTRPQDYTTSQIGNASIAWMKTVVESGPKHPPFFAWLGTAIT